MLNTLEITVGKKAQIVIPRNFRLISGIKEGDVMIMSVDAKTGRITMTPKPKQWAETVTGCCTSLSSDALRNERESWE